MNLIHQQQAGKEAVEKRSRVKFGSSIYEISLQYELILLYQYYFELYLYYRVYIMSDVQLELAYQMRALIQIFPIISEHLFGSSITPDVVGC